MTHPHVEPPTIPLMKETHNSESSKYFIKLKLRRYPTSSTLDLYEFKISLFENVKPEVLFVCNLNMTLTASRTLEAGAKYQYLRNLVRGEALRQFDLLSANVESTETLKVYNIVKALSQYFPPVNSLSKQKHVMRRGMKKLTTLL